MCRARSAGITSLLPDGVTAADIEVALRNIGIFLK